MQHHQHVHACQKDRENETSYWQDQPILMLTVMMIMRMMMSIMTMTMMMMMMMMLMLMLMNLRLCSDPSSAHPLWQRVGGFWTHDQYTVFLRMHGSFLGKTWQNPCCFSRPGYPNPIVLSRHEKGWLIESTTHETSETSKVCYVCYASC